MSSNDQGPNFLGKNPEGDIPTSSRGRNRDPDLQMAVERGPCSRSRSSQVRKPMASAWRLPGRRRR